MTNSVIAWLEAELAKAKAAVEPAAAAVETDVKEAGSEAWNLIKTQGLQDVYTIAENTLLAAIAGAPWTGTLAAIETAAVAAGKTLGKEVIASIGAAAQADLLAAGKLLPPVAPAA